MDFSRHISVPHTNKFKVASYVVLLGSMSRQKGKITQTRRPFRSKLFHKHHYVISARSTTPRQNKLSKTNENTFNNVILVLPCYSDNKDSKVEYRFPLSFKRQSNLHFWPLFDEKL